jgi:hypothetical protein
MVLAAPGARALITRSGVYASNTSFCLSPGLRIVPTFASLLAVATERDDRTRPTASNNCSVTLAREGQAVTRGPGRKQMSSWVQDDPFADLEIPEVLQQSLARHRENLARLVVSLQSAGLNDQQIETSVSVMVESYKEELLRAIRALVEVHHG